MKVSFKYPLDLYIVGPSRESLDLKTSFLQEPKYSVKLCLEGQEPLELKEGPPETKFFRRNTFLTFEIECQTTDPSELERFRLLVKNDQKRQELLNLLVEVINRTLDNIRNFGIVAHVREVHPREEEVEACLRHWQVKFSENEGEYQDILPMPKDTLSLLFSALYPSAQEVPELRISTWPDIEEAIQDNLKPSPEQEFLTNTIEFLRTGNLRMALLESIICLEIVLTQYLRAFLVIDKKMSLNRINKKFLTSRLELSTRLAGLLDFTLDSDDLKKIDIQKILKAVEWRNHIVHRTGHFPLHLKEKNLREGITNVLTLVLLLAKRRDQIQAQPELQEISRKISQDNDIPLPTIWLIRKHIIYVEVQFFSSPIPNKSVLEKVIHDLSEELENRDPRFEPDNHLYVRFVQFPKKTIARWRRGTLEVIKEEKQKVEL